MQVEEGAPDKLLLLAVDLEIEELGKKIKATQDTDKRSGEQVSSRGVQGVEAHSLRGGRAAFFLTGTGAGRSASARRDAAGGAGHRAA